jgi:hypothetical protein
MSPCHQINKFENFIGHIKLKSWMFICPGSVYRCTLCVDYIHITHSHKMYIRQILYLNTLHIPLSNTLYTPNPTLIHTLETICKCSPECSTHFHTDVHFRMETSSCTRRIQRAYKMLGVKPRYPSVTSRLWPKQCPGSPEIQ